MGVAALEGRDTNYVEAIFVTLYNNGVLVVGHGEFLKVLGVV